LREQAIQILKTIDPEDKRVIPALIQAFKDHADICTDTILALA